MAGETAELPYMPHISLGTSGPSDPSSAARAPSCSGNIDSNPQHSITPMRMSCTGKHLPTPLFVGQLLM